MLEWNPPRRFIERVEDKANCTPDEVDAYFREVDVEKVLVGSSLAYFNRMGHASKKNKKSFRSRLNESGGSFIKPINRSI